MMTSAYLGTAHSLPEHVPMSGDAALRLEVATRCFDPPRELLAPYSIHPGIVGLLTEEELDENILFLGEDSFRREEFLVGGLLALPYRELVTLVADGGVGKSLLATDLALSIAAGRDFLGQETRSGTALYLDFEQERSTASRRLRKLSTQAGIERRTLNQSFRYRNFKSRGTNLFEVEGEILDLAARVRPDIIVLDSWAAATGIDSNDERDVNRAFNVLKKFLKWGTVFILAHPSDGGVRAKADQMKPSGHRQQRQQPRLIYGLVGQAGANRLTLGVSKTNEPLERTIFKLERIDTLVGQGLRHVLLDEDRGSNEAKEGMPQEGPRLPKHLEFIRDTVKSRGQVTREEMRSMLVERGMTASTADKALRRQQLESISKWVQLVPDEHDSRSKRLVWHGKMIVPIAENTGQTPVR